MGVLWVIFLPYIGIAQNVERWMELEAVVDTTGFSAIFVDSLRKAFGIQRKSSLRQVTSSVFNVPEKVVLEAKWGPFRAGYAILHTAFDSLTATAKISVIAVTTRVTSRLFKVKDFVRSTMEPTGLYPLFFEEHIEEGRYRATRWVLFDHSDTTAYSNRKGRERTSIPCFTQDYLSLFCYIRSLPLTPGCTFSLSCYVQGKVYDVSVHCGQRDCIRTELGDFNCIIVEPKFAADGRNFSRRDRVQLWLTDDTLHMLVKIRAKLKIGSVDGDMIYFRRGDQERRRPSE